MCDLEQFCRRQRSPVMCHVFEIRVPHTWLKFHKKFEDREIWNSTFAWRRENPSGRAHALTLTFCVSTDSAALACKIKLTADVNRLMFGFTVSRSKVVSRVLETTDNSRATYEIAIKLSRICLVYNSFFLFCLHVLFRRIVKELWKVNFKLFVCWICTTLSNSL